MVMTMKKFFLILLCVLFISSAPLMFTFVFCNTLSYDMPDATQISYMDVITNEYAQKNYQGIEPPVDKQLDRALKKYKFKPVKLSEAISVLRDADKENSEKIYIYHGNYDLVFVDGREFCCGYLIFTQTKTYFFAEYLSNNEYLGITPIMVTLYELQGESSLDRNDFQHIKSENIKLFSGWIADRLKTSCIRIANIATNNIGKSIFLVVIYVVLSSGSVYILKKQRINKNKNQGNNQAD